MKDISLQFDKYLKIIKQNCKNSDSCLSLYHGQCKCEKLAEIWTLIESLIPPDCVKLDLSDFNGFVAGDDVSLPVNVIREAKATLGTYCWGDYKDCLLPTFNSNSVEALNASVMDERLSNGDCLIIHGDKLSKTVDNYGKVILSKKRTGKTLLSSIVLKEAIKRRLFPKNAALTFEYVTYQSLKFRTKQKDNPLVLDYRSCDWLVVDDIYLDKKGSEDSRSYSKDMIDSVILERIDQRLPTILIFQFNIDSFVGDEIQDMYGNGIYRIASNPKTFKISLSGGVD